MPVINFINALLGAYNQIQQTSQAQTMTETINKEPTEIKIQGDKATIKLTTDKNILKSMGRRDLRPDIYQMYNIGSAPDINTLPMEERAKAQASMDLANMSPEKPESGILGFLKAIPLGGFRFDRRLGWGNVINALSSGVLGKQMLEDKYENDRLNYEKMKTSLTDKYLNQEISINDYNRRLKEEEIKLETLKKTKEALFKQINVFDYGKTIFGDEDMAKEFEGLTNMMGFAENVNGKTMANLSDMTAMAKQVEEIFPSGITGWAEFTMRNKMAGAKNEEEKRKWQGMLDNFNKAIVNPSTELLQQMSENKTNNAIELEKLKNANRIELEGIKQAYNMQRLQFQNEMKGGKMSNENFDKYYNSALSNIQRLQSIKLNYLKFGESEDSEKIKEIDNIISSLKKDLALLKPHTEAGKLGGGLSEKQQIMKKAIVNFLKGNKNLTQEKAVIFINRLAKYHNIDTDEAVDFYNQIVDELNQ